MKGKKETAQSDSLFPDPPYWFWKAIEATEELDNEPPDDTPTLGFI
jgi:hypothetical protein